MYVSSRDQLLTGKDLSGRDLRDHDLTGKVLFGTDLRGSALKGAAISIDCATFEGCKLDNNQIATLLAMLCKADIDRAWIDGLAGLIEQVTGTERSAAIERLLKVS